MWLSKCSIYKGPPRSPRKHPTKPRSGEAEPLFSWFYIWKTQKGKKLKNLGMWYATAAAYSEYLRGFLNNNSSLGKKASPNAESPVTTSSVLRNMNNMYINIHFEVGFSSPFSAQLTSRVFQQWWMLQTEANHTHFWKMLTTNPTISLLIYALNTHPSPSNFLYFSLLLFVVFCCFWFGLFGYLNSALNRWMLMLIVYKWMVDFH